MTDRYLHHLQPRRPEACAAWLLALVCLFSWDAQDVAAQSQLFWTDINQLTLETAGTDLSQRHVLNLFVFRPDHLAIDGEAGKIYWIDQGFSTDDAETAWRLRRANFDGTEAETLVLNLRAHYGLIVDGEGGRVYWSEPEQSRIRSANLDGSDVQVFLDADDGLGYPGAMAFDAQARRIFWIDSDADMIRSVNPDGTDLVDVVASGGLFGLAVDPSSESVYWTVYRDQEIRRAGYDGTGEEVVIETDARPQMVAVDPSDERIYWSTASILSHGLHGAAFDGSGAVDYAEPSEVRALITDPASGRVLWSGDGEASASGIGVIDAATGETDVLLPGGNLRDVEADASAGYVFWNEGEELIRMRFDGSEQMVVHEAGFAPQGIDLDRSAEKVYFASGGGIYRMNYDGSGVEQVTDQTTAGLGDLAVDTQNGFVFWAGNSSTDFGFIERANLDGTDRRQVLTDLDYPRGLRTNPADGTIYWAYGGNMEGDPAGIRMAGADGSNVTDVITTLETPRDLAIDVEEGKLYWTDSGTNRIERADLDGSSVETIVAEGLETPAGLTVVDAATTSRDDHALPNQIVLNAAYPNPFNPQTSIGFELPQGAHVHLAVYDLLGREVRVLIDGRRAAGHHEVSFQAADLSSGVYVYRLVAAGVEASRTLTLIK